MNHDRRQIRPICYADVSSPDEMTQQMSRSTAEWRLIRGRSDAEVADQIRADHVDILIDLAGHTGTRLGVFARRPAPLQVTWLGYPATTGLPSIQYFLSDRWASPAEQPLQTVEEVVRLPTTFCCYAPSADAPAVSSSPAEQVGAVTFGSTHKLAKLNDAVLKVWCAALVQIPSSRLVVYRNCLHGRAAERLRRRLIDFGLPEHRFVLQHQIHGGHLAIYDRIDVLLDVWPWTGHATVCEALWQGVPALSLRGNRHSSRMVSSVLQQVGLTEFIADSSNEFVSKAVAIAADHKKLSRLRREIRERMKRSPLCDARRFTAELEGTFRELWQRRVFGRS